MPATPADIAAASRDAVTVTWESAAIGVRYPSARDGSVSPATGYFDSAADAQAVVNARGGLVGVERRRFAVGVDELVWPDLAAGVPTMRLVDAEQGVDAAMLSGRVEVDLEAETSAFEKFG